MKRTSLLLKIAALGGSAIAISPFVLTATACAPKSMMVDSYDFDTIVNFESGTLHTNYVNTTFKTVLYGNKKFHNGNYILISGSSLFSNVSFFFTNQDRIRDRESWFKDEYFKASILYSGAMAVGGELSDEEKDIGFYNVMDFFDGKVYDTTNHLIYVWDKKGQRDKIGPFEKWTDELIAETDRFNNSDQRPDGKYDWDEESVTTDDYIRNDINAQAFREFSKLGARLYPTSEEEGGRKTTFYTGDEQKGQIAFFKDGVVKDIQDIPSKYQDFKDSIIKYYKEEEDPESQV